MQNFVPVLSYGMGVESTAILLRWLEEPDSRDFDLADLVVITAQTGDEWPDTRRDIEHHILPRLRRQSVRYVQVARAGHLEKDGIVVLDDSRRPEKCQAQGSYKLSDELRAAGTVPQFGGEHRCSLKFKAFVIETWLQQNLFQPVRHTFGYNAEEVRRVAKSEAAIRITFGFNSDETGRVEKGKAYDRPCRIGHYPLVEWGWDRVKCLAYIKHITGTDWHKSACSYCPFAKLSPDLFSRQKQHPIQVSDAMVLEHLSLAMNPRGQLYKSKPLYQVVAETGNEKARQRFESRTCHSRWAIYRVRRVYAAKGKAQRCVERLEEFGDRVAASSALLQLAKKKNLEMREVHGLSYAHARLRGDTYPTSEEYYVATLATVDTKARYGVERFEQQWERTPDLYCGRDDLPLFAHLDAEASVTS